MEDIKNFSGNGFDLERAKKCASSYSRSVGVGCMIIDSHGEILFYSGCQNSICDLCKKLQSIEGSHLNCQSAHLYGAYQAERFGGKYIYFCSLGLVHWTSPITSSGMMCGAMVAGPVLMVEPDEFLLYDIIRDNISKKGLDAIKNHINEIPIIKPDRVNSMSELLFITAMHVSDIQPSRYQEEREYQEQLLNVSKYIDYFKTMGGDISNLGAYPLEKEKELLSLVSLGDKAASQKVLNQIFGHIFFSTSGNFEVIKSRVLELVVLLSRAALEGGADVEQIFGMNYKYLGQIHNFKTIEELTYWLSQIMTRFTDCVFNFAHVKHMDIIYKAIDYIKRNYMKKITLEDVASHVYLSVSYFSKVFNDEMKCSFNTYLNKIRIEASKKLLMDESLSLIDISNLVGYEDQSYFSKVFKKITGMSPGRYRETRGQLKAGKPAAST